MPCPQPSPCPDRSELDDGPRAGDTYSVRGADRSRVPAREFLGSMRGLSEGLPRAAQVWVLALGLVNLGLGVGDS